MAEQTQGDAPEQTNEAAPSESGGQTDYEKAAAEGSHLDTAARGGTNFAPDLTVGAGVPAVQSGAIPGGDYYALRKIRDEGRRAHIAEQAEAVARSGQPDPRLLTTGGLATTFETDAQGNVVPDSVRILGATAAPTVQAGATPAGADAAASPGGAGAPTTTPPATGADGQPATTSTPTTADTSRGGTR